MPSIHTASLRLAAASGLYLNAGSSQPTNEAHQPEIAGETWKQHLLALRARSFAEEQAYYWQQDCSFDPQERRALFEQLLVDHRAGSAWLILSKQQVIGYVILAYGFSLECSGVFALLNEFFVLPAYRRAGIGTAVLRFLEAFCHDKLQISVVRLEVEQANEAVLTHSPSCGFGAHGRDLHSLFGGYIR